ncbi:ABC transporter ATP-binding protein [Paenibacillus aquistagni]|uniref:ABC transporter ATP-binding protein n=1 Tax=Paenibacillus aquistagni TaxID=1852522 RepID=UPI00145BD8A2|nr:ABC transporter ATP-binding protein [Paenibacillus aquistagni]NMM52460.1 ABC transporter ATP-binding protein [Paenibacillus aquistagni]
MLKLFRYLKPFRMPIVFVLLLVFFQSLSDLYLPNLMSKIVDTGIVQGDVPYIWRVGLIMLVVALIGTACMIGASYLSAKVATGYGKQLRSRVFNHVQHFSLQEFDEVGTASLITRTTNDITQVQQVLVMILRMMVMAPIMCIGGIIMALQKDAELTLILLVIIPLLALAVFLVARKGIPLFKAMQKKLDKLNLVLRENLIGIRVIRSFNRVEDEKERFQAANKDLTDTAVRVNRIMASLMPIMMFAMNFATISIVFFGAKQINAGELQVGDMMAFIQYAMQIMFSLIMVSMMFVMIPRASASAARINEVLDMSPVIVDQAEVKATKGLRGLVEFDRVTFSYPGAEEPALSDITFTARPGETTAIIGGTGAGKSTLLNLIPRFYDISKGSIKVDGIDIRDMAQDQLREKIGLVPQKAVLFTGTIRDNIRYGKEDATEEEIVHAASIAQATDFITSMKDGFDSPIAQGGTNVSGGQKQRLSIARALIRRPEIYIFDDSFSALDFKTDANLRKALKSETTEATVIIVAQRVSTVMDADQIIVMDEGRIAAVGTHQQLLESSEVYREIVSSQLSEEEIA